MCSRAFDMAHNREKEEFNRYAWKEFETKMREVLGKLGIPYDIKVRLITCIAVYEYIIIRRELLRQRFLDKGISEYDPYIKMIIDACWEKVPEPVEDFIERRLREKGIKIRR